MDSNERLDFRLTEQALWCMVRNPQKLTEIYNEVVHGGYSTQE